jgi:hypothetical protein
VVGADPHVAALGVLVGGDGKDPLAGAAVQDAVVPPTLAVIDADALVDRAGPDPAEGVHVDGVNMVGGGVFGGELPPRILGGGVGLQVQPPEAAVLRADPQGLVGGAEGGDELARLVEGGPIF